MNNHDSKGPETPRPSHWMGDEPLQTVGDPLVEQGTLPHYGTGADIGFWQMERPVHRGVNPLISPDPGQSHAENVMPDADRQDL